MTKTKKPELTSIEIWPGEVFVLFGFENQDGMDIYFELWREGKKKFDISFPPMQKQKYETISEYELKSCKQQIFNYLYKNPWVVTFLWSQ